MKITKQFKAEIKPFFWVEHDTGASVCLNADRTYMQGIFNGRADIGFGNGYDWTSLAREFIDERCPKLPGNIEFDPEADMFSAYSKNEEALAKFILLFKKDCEDLARKESGHE